MSGNVRLAPQKSNQLGVVEAAFGVAFALGYVIGGRQGSKPVNL